MAWNAMVMIWILPKSDVPGSRFRGVLLPRLLGLHGDPTQDTPTLPETNVISP